MKKQTDISHMDRRTLLFTPDLIESFVNCRYKAYLKLAGQHGVISDFEAMVIERKDRVRTSLAQKLESRCGLHGVADGRQTTEASLHEGIEFLLECHLSTSNFSMHFDGLKKTDGTSALGPFHYIPVLLIGHHQIAKTHRAVAEIIGASLSGIQGRAPSYAIIYHGPNCQASRVSLSTAPDSGKSMLTELVDLAKSLVVPRLLLNSHCELCEFQSKCRMQAIEEDNLSLLRGIGLREMTSYERRGILKLSQLAHTFRPKRKQKSGRRDLALQAMAIRDATVYVLGQPEIRPSAISVYVDIEFDPYDGYTYLLGMLVCADEQEEYHSFWAESKDEEERILEDFLATLSRYDSPMLFCYGAYERIWFERMRRTARSKELVDTMLPATINTLGLVYKHFYFPTYSNGLKHVGRFVGASWSDPQSSGLQSIVWHRKWDQSRDEIWKAKLMVYNCEDCSALRRVTDFIRTYSEHLPHNVEESTTNPMVVKVEQMSLPTYDTKWGRPQSAHQDFEFVNGRAYFDYQRQRVFVRSSRAIRTSQSKKDRQERQPIRVARKIEIVATKCPECGGSELHVTKAGAQGSHRKLAYDLVITRSGMKRIIIEYRTKVYDCSECGNRFVPDYYQRIAKHHHRLVSWAVYHQIAYGLSNRAVESMFCELFRMRIAKSEIHMFKSVLARQYAALYQELHAAILGGSLVHVDETEVKMRGGKAYVWVFTNLEEVLYVYRPDRKGEFLHDFLAGFQGVLVSDFYAAYDSLPCPQQKCLIHLIRDMNAQILANPFDPALLSITGNFGSLLRPIVEKVDRYGLKRSRLSGSQRKVLKFFRWLQSTAFETAASTALRHRLLKNRGRLFSFIEHDGVPWNNNNAEHAIKQFAHHRDAGAGVFRESGLSEFLVLLSIQQTCRYKGVGFLDFLLSGSTNLSSVRNAKPLGRMPPKIEVLPKGFDPYRTRRLAK